MTTKRKTRRTITEAEAERIVDLRVAKALAGSARYQNAESAEAQAEVEEELSETAWNFVAMEYVVA